MDIHQTLPPLRPDRRRVHGMRVLMDLLQPQIMSRIVDDGVLGLSTGGVGDMRLIVSLGLRMIGLVLFGGLCGSLNNVFVHITGQSVGMRCGRMPFGTS